MEIQIFSWIMDIFFMLTLHIFYKQFMGVKYESKLLLTAGWSICFFLWNINSYLLDGNAPASSLSTVMLTFFVLYFFYRGDVSYKILLIIVVVVMGIVSEGITVFFLKLSGMFEGKYYEDGLSFTLLACALSKIIWFMFVKVIALLSQKQKYVRIKMSDWIEVFLVPVGSILICCVIWWEKERYVTALQILILSVLLVINLSVYYLYQKIQLHVAASVENEVLKQQNEYFRVRDEDFEQQWLKLRRMSHNMANNRVLEMDYLEKGEYELLMEHYKEQVGEIKSPGAVVYTGNIGIDSIVNYKLEASRELHITVDRMIEIADKVEIANIDLNILVGNLMDNAIEAVRDMDVDKRKITLLIRTDKTAFFLEISNPFEGERSRNKEGDFLTGKRDKMNHGLGLREVKEIVGKYDGQFTVDIKGNEFNIKVLLYMNSDCYDENKKTGVITV